MKSGLWPLLAGVSMAVCAQAALAADADQGAIAPGEITVNGQRTVDPTATKTGTPLILTPQMISVIDRRQIALQNIQSVPQALRYVPGVQTEQSGADNRIETNQFMIRGFNAQEYLDGLRLQSGTWAAPQLDPYALQQIDVLKGPASVLYGQASPGGLVALTSRRPSATAGGEVMLQAGNYGRIQAAGDITGALTRDGSLSARLTGLYRDTDTQVDHTKYRRWFIAPALSWRPDADTELTLLGNYQRDPNAGFYNQIPAPGVGLPSQFGKIPTSFYGGEPDYDRLRRTQESIGYAFSHRFSSIWSVRQNLRYTHISTDYRAVTFESLAPDGHTLRRSPYAAKETLDSFAVDTQVQADFATGPLTHKLLFGVDYQHSRWDHQAAYAPNQAPTLDWLDPVYGQPVPAAPTIQDGLQRQRQTGVYVQDQIAFGGLNLVLGGREDWFHSRDFNRLTDGRTATGDHIFTGRAGLVYLFDFGLAPYVNYSTSFQPATGVTFDGRAFAPTKGEQYEAGVKYQPVDFPGFVTVSVYRLTQSNVTTADLTHPGFSAQVGEIRSQGVELDGHVSPVKGLNLQATYTYLDLDITKDTRGLQGKTLPAVSKNSASFWADYAPEEGALAGFKLGGGVRYIGKTFGNYANSYTVPGNALFDAVIGYDLGHVTPRLDGWSLQLNASNLFDKTYVAACGNLGCYYGLRRQIIANIRYAW